MKERKSRKIKPLKITYHFVEPKNEEEARIQERTIDEAFNKLFVLLLGEQEIWKLKDNLNK